MAPPRKEAPSASSSASQQSKRVKFDEAGLEATADIDGDEDDLEDVKNRREVNTQGYDSDSSDDGEGVVPSRKPGANPEEDDNSDDMFAEPTSSAATNNKGKGNAKSGKDKYLGLGDIEGQEFGNGDEDDDGFKSDDSKDGMGYELSSFNMKAELREGAFTEDGAYVNNAKDRLEIHDRWMDGLDGKAEIRKAREAKRKRDKAEEERKKKEMEEVRDGPRREDLVAEIVALLEPSETVLKGLQRLGAGSGSGKPGKRLTWAEKQKERKRALTSAAAVAATPAPSTSDHMDAEPLASTTTTTEPSAPSSFDRLSTIVSDLTALGQLDLYNMTREALSRLLPPPASSSVANSASTTGQSSESVVPPSTSSLLADDGSKYEYRYSMEYIRSLPESERPVEREVFGPFPKPSILQWRAQGFFGGLGGAPERVELRRVGAAPEWVGFWTLFG
ncbi:Uncharacterized protein involved in protein-protein interaction, contains polyproline-binding GYF domain [Phaffia rhodozyma]|uniref:Uncharacterized protein involved in protein-protein interaction, contains polyproline-binding GYF domain n=1 Tax=Phaffia rhodozyma TaxID=264483 RepID=A0A0F7SFM0_PHARH|nr:Uncharacterized protein involved in protein-protein interaction, contains polyproline-binding GYF domain [Phaffia rhodozyma]